MAKELLNTNQEKQDEEDKTLNDPGLNTEEQTKQPLTSTSGTTEQSLIELLLKTKIRP